MKHLIECHIDMSIGDDSIIYEIEYKGFTVQVDQDETSLFSLWVIAPDLIHLCEGTGPYTNLAIAFTMADRAIDEFINKGLGSLFPRQTHELVSEPKSKQSALDAIQKYSRVPYPNNTTDWKAGDLVIHKADAKRSDMLMRVIGYTRDGRCKTKYVAGTGRIWTNPISELLDPALFGIDTKGGNHEQ